VAARPWVLLDTNAVLLAVVRRFPVEAEVHRWVEGGEIRIPTSVRGELTRLAERAEEGASMALAWAARYPSAPAPGRGDAAIVEAAVRLRAWVVTGDRRLAERLRAVGVPVLAPRDRRHLEPRSPAAPRRARPARR
jgi:rRNA-processing protein FCF1